MGVEHPVLLSERDRTSQGGPVDDRDTERSGGLNQKPYTLYEVEGRSGGRWKRVVAWTLVGLVVLMLCTAGVAYAWFRAQVSGANDRLSPEIKVVLSEKPSTTLGPTGETEVEVPDSPSAMNLLVLGSDRREGEEGEPSRSDTIILVHVDPEQDYLSLLSLPRDFRVEVPGYGFNKINYAFAVGGAALAIRTVEQVTGVDINHYIEVDFDAFRDITDSLGGVYVDVDRRYYNDNPAYELIKLAPGYQLLDGDDALDYVRFRRDLNLDFGRMERQQTFLSAVKEQAMGWDLPFKLPRLVSALFSNVATDLGANDILKLAYWAIRLDGQNIRRIALTGAADELDGVAYVFIDDEALAEAVDGFLSASHPISAPSGGSGASSTGGSGASSTTTSITAAPDLGDIEVDVLNANGRTGEAAAAGRFLSSLGATVVTVGNAGRTVAETSVEYPAGQAGEAEDVAAVLKAGSVQRNAALERVTVILGEDFVLPSDYALPPSPDTIPAAGGWKKIAQMVPYAVRAPAHLPEGYFFVERMPPQGATYDIKVGGGTKPAFKMLYRLKQHGRWTDQYMGITETTWLDAPAAAQGREVRHDGITYTVVGSRDKVERVWWKADGVLYWVSNTLFHLLSEQELLAVAQSMIRIPPE